MTARAAGRRMSGVGVSSPHQAREGSPVKVLRSADGRCRLASRLVLLCGLAAPSSLLLAGDGASSVVPVPPQARVVMLAPVPLPDAPTPCPLVGATDEL